MKLSLSAQIAKESIRFMSMGDDFNMLLAQHVQALAQLVRRVETPGADPLSVDQALDRMAMDTDENGQPGAIVPGIDFISYTTEAPTEPESVPEIEDPVYESD